MTNDNNPTNRCHGCGQPPHNNTNGIIIPLKRCSRCKKVWYHNSECQRNDWKRHRQQDNCIALQNDTKRLMVSHQEQSYHILIQEKKGNSLMASKLLTMGDVVLVDTNPIVPPVLREDYRLQRCAICFAKLNSVVVHSVETRNSYGSSNLYPIRLCSRQCQSVSNGWIEQESQVVEKTLIQHSSATLPKILPTAILLYRIARYLRMTFQDDDHNHVDHTVDHNDIPNKRQQILNLYPPDRSVLRYTKQNAATTTNNNNTGNDKEEEEETHKIAVLFTVHNLLLHDPKTRQQYSSSKSNTTIIDLELLLLKLKTNSFTITDGESTPIGIGLYSLASNINHSCDPNILPTFQYGIPGTTPHIRFTVCCCQHPILPGNELCIPYMDVTAPQSLRKQWLQNSYYFDCDCVRCTTTTTTDITTTKEEESLEIHKTLSLYKHEQNFLSMEQKFPASSWYYQESGERYLQALLDSIGGPNFTNQHTMTTCQQALELVYKLILPFKNQNKKNQDGWRILRTCLLTYKCAKLRLFLQHDDPILAIQELQQCLATYQLFYDKNHEFLQELQETIQQAYGI
jgi:MYND finger/SET domain